MQPLEEAHRLSLPPAEAQSALRASEETYRTIVTTAAEGIWTLDAEARTTFVNDRLASMLGYRAEARVGRKLHDCRDREGRARAAGSFMRRDRRSGGEGDFRFRRQDGSAVWLRPATSPLLGPRGEFVGALAMVSDVTERRRAEESMARLAAIVESSEDAIFATGLNGTILSWNAGAERLFGYRPSEAIGCHVAIVAPPSQAAETGRISRLIRAGQAVRDLETVRRRKDGTEVVVSLSISPLRDTDGRLTGASAIARDITEISKGEDERRQLEEQLRQAQNLEPELLDPAERGRGLLAMIGRPLGEDVRVTRAAAPALGRVEADRSQLEQVILNLAVNARDAMPAGGSLTFELRDVELDRAQASARVGLRPGPHVVLKGSDPGIGIDA